MICPSRDLKPEIDFLASRDCGFCPTIMANSLTSSGKILSEKPACWLRRPMPVLTTILSIFLKSVLVICFLDSQFALLAISYLHGAFLSATDSGRLSAILAYKLRV